MCRRLGIAGILLASTLWLAGCALWEGVGPCYGVGCHAGLVAPHSAAQSAQASPPTVKTSTKSKSFTSWLPFTKKHPAAAENDAPVPSSSTSPSTASTGLK